MPRSIDSIYSNFSINRRQAQTLAFLILNEVEDYARTHQAEFEEYLKAEELKESEVYPNE